MPKVFNLGSINMDQIVRLGHFPAPGETISGELVGTALGGKGLNVSVALARAAMAPVHIGAIGAGDQAMIAALNHFEVDQTHIARVSVPSGSAYVFLDTSGENSIVVCAGSNNAITSGHIQAALQDAQAGDWFCLQNETNAQAEAAEMARAKGMKVAYMAAPFDAGKIVELTGKIDLLALNETEARQLEEHAGQPIDQLGIDQVLVTLGSKGATFRKGAQVYSVQGRSVEVVDTTAAGDTFFGFFLAEYLRSDDPDQSLKLANTAASITVQTEGAAQAIPTLDRVLRDM